MFLKRIAALTPYHVQQELRRAKALADIRLGRFRAPEPEYQLMPTLVNEGDWILDIGANIGQYTWLFSKLAGSEGRVFALEPIPATVEILASVVRRAPYQNVTILNVAVSETAGIVAFDLPDVTEEGLPNYFQARIAPRGAHRVYSCAIDQLDFPHRIALVKIDTEGHEEAVLRGMRRLIERDRPVLIVEGAGSLLGYLEGYGYTMRPKALGSPNLIFSARLNASLK